MDVQDIINQARDALTVKRVFGDPYKSDDITVFPVARVWGGAGGGSGEDQSGGKGTGSGFGIRAAPAGVYLLKGDKLSWRPAVDVNKIIVGGQIVVVVGLIVARSIVKQVTKNKR